MKEEWQKWGGVRATIVVGTVTSKGTDPAAALGWLLPLSMDNCLRQLLAEGGAQGDASREYELLAPQGQVFAIVFVSYRLLCLRFLPFLLESRSQTPLRSPQMAAQVKREKRERERKTEITRACVSGKGAGGEECRGGNGIAAIG